MINPRAVLISDVHYNVHTLPLADAAMILAINKANELDVPLIVAGDLHDTKANLRGECINAMLETFSLCKTTAYILRGNHDAINEKSKESAIDFLQKEPTLCEDSEIVLAPGRITVNNPGFYNDLWSVNGMSVHLCPYHHDTKELKKYLAGVDKGSTIIMHQGIAGSNSGEYIQDKSAITADDVSGFRIISGHYHTRQTIWLPNGGKWDYIGNPYTLGFGEANDPEKGFQILYNDGSLEFVSTNLRRHIIMEANQDGSYKIDECDSEDLVWFKVTGDRKYLSLINKEKLKKQFSFLPENFKLDLIPLDTVTSKPKKQLSQNDLLDSMIDSLTNTSDIDKLRLKSKWKELT